MADEQLWECCRCGKQSPFGSPECRHCPPCPPSGLIPTVAGQLLERLTKVPWHASMTLTPVEIQYIVAVLRQAVREHPVALEAIHYAQTNRGLQNLVDAADKLIAAQREAGK